MELGSRELGLGVKGRWSELDATLRVGRGVSFVF